jgi:hypothetical protein
MRSDTHTFRVASAVTDRVTKGASGYCRVKDCLEFPAQGTEEVCAWIRMGLRLIPAVLDSPVARVAVHFLSPRLVPRALAVRLQ